MVKTYSEILPRNYFGDLYTSVVKNLSNSENVCVSVIPGYGYKTIFSFIQNYLVQVYPKIQIKTVDCGQEQDKLISDLTKNQR